MCSMDFPYVIGNLFTQLHLPSICSQCVTSIRMSAPNSFSLSYFLNLTSPVSVLWTYVFGSTYPFLILPSARFNKQPVPYPCNAGCVSADGNVLSMQVNPVWLGSLQTSPPFISRTCSLLTRWICPTPKLLDAWNYFQSTDWFLAPPEARMWLWVY